MTEKEGNTTVIENQLVRVSEAAIGGEVVNSVDARELHSFLEVGQDYSTWIKSRIEQYGFTQGIDFIQFHNFVESNSKARVEYTLSLDMAKEVSMVERNEKGKQARKYFIAMERKAKGISVDSRRPEQLDLGYIALGYLKKHLSMSDVSYLGCAKKLHDDLGVSTAMLPQYVENVRLTFSATDLINKNNIQRNGKKLSAVAFNKMLLSAGYLEEKERASTKGTKKFKALTDLGLQYGTNDVSPNNPREIQAHYFEDTFVELFGRVEA